MVISVIQSAKTRALAVMSPSIEGCLPSVGAQLSRPSGLQPCLALIAFNPVHPRSVSGAVVRLSAPFKRTSALPQRSAAESLSVMDRQKNRSTAG